MLSRRFPKGYTLQFVPFYAAEYTGFHWAVYDQTKRFYSYDDGDATSGETRPQSSWYRCSRCIGIAPFRHIPALISEACKRVASASVRALTSEDLTVLSLIYHFLPETKIFHHYYLLPNH